MQDLSDDDDDDGDGDNDDDVWEVHLLGRWTGFVVPVDVFDVFDLRLRARSGGGGGGGHRRRVSRLRLYRNDGGDDGDDGGDGTAHLGSFSSSRSS